MQGYARRSFHWLGFLLVIFRAVAEPPVAAILTPREVSLKCAPAVVRVEQWSGSPAQRHGIITGVIVEAPTKDVIWIATIVSQFSEGDSLKVDFTSNIIDARVVGRDTDLWLTIVEVEAFPEAPPARMEIAPTAPAAGADCYFIDAAHQAYEEPAKARTAGWEDEGSKISLLRANLGEGDTCAGSPLLNQAGQVIGLIAKTAGPSQSVLAVPAVALEKCRRDAAKFGKFTRPWLGVLFDDEISAPLVAGLQSSSPAERAGMREGDLILTLAGKPIRDVQEMANLSFLLEPDQPVELVLLRGLEKVTVQVTPQHAPEKVE